MLKLALAAAWAKKLPTHGPEECLLFMTSPVWLGGLHGEQRPALLPSEATSVFDPQATKQSSFPKAPGARTVCRQKSIRLSLEGEGERARERERESERERERVQGFGLQTSCCT